MMRNRSLALAAAVLLIAGTWVAMHRSNQQGDLGGGSVFNDLTPALGGIGEIRLSKGDGSRTTLRKQPNGWTVVERAYPADAGRVRELVLALTNMKIIEHKTSDPANYARLGVETPDTPTAASTLVEVVAGQKSWSLIVGKNAEGRAMYVRKPKEATSALVEPAVSADPDQKRWLDRQLVDIAGGGVHEVSVHPANGPAYLLTRATRDNGDLALSPVPNGRKAASNMVINGQADALTSFNFDDVRPVPATLPAAVEHAVYRTFDGQVIEFAGHKEGDKAFVTVAASNDAALAAQFAEPAPKPNTPAPAPGITTAAGPATSATPTAATTAVSPAATKAADGTVERLSARARGVEFEIPLYKYESLFKPLEDLLEKKPEPPAKAAKSTKPAAGPAAKPSTK